MATKSPYAATVHPRPRANGTVAYDVRYRDQGKSRRMSFDSKRAAEKWANVVKAIGPTDALAMLNIATLDTSPTVDEYAATYINAKSGVEGQTLDHYRTYMRLHISPVLGRLPIDAVSAAAIAAWINGQTAAGAAAKSIKNRHGFLSAMFQSAVDDELITKNPCARSKLPESEELEMVFLSADEFTTLLAYIPVKYQPFVLLLAATGLRWGEATALRAGDFDLDARTVRVSRAWKTSVERGNYIGPPKTRRSKRTVSIPEDLCATIRPLIEEGHEYVFTNSQGNPIRQQKFWEWVWAPARRLANGQPAFDKSRGASELPWKPRTNGVWDTRKPAAKPLGKSPRIHDLRHSHASWLLAAGYGIDVVQRRLGHESITTTVDRYGHISLERQAQAGEGIGVILAGAMPQLTV
jgi:integrase